MSNKPKSFEIALKDFDESIEALENENVNIDEAIKIYEEGLSKYEACIKILDEAKQKIEIVKE
ncbi:MAG: exodeoxyribonuclease VII small subunit [Anaerovoracaceae bacterium]